ncbi:MAG: ABC transporter permease [Spirochaetaceae bacterium]|nr:ABC transporter permease [Spirochaetaceae bacterium]
MIVIIFTSMRNFVRNLKHYRVLIMALILIVAVLTIVLAVVLGMRTALYNKASRYFAGNIVVMGYNGSGTSIIEQPAVIEEAAQKLESYGVSVRCFSRRSIYYDLNNIELFFSGYYIKQRRMVGVEWDLERPVLRDFYFTEGSIPAKDDEKAVLISTASADQLRISVGDKLLVSIRSDLGHINTTELIVRGIFSESSFFGYQTYLHRKTLNRLREAPVDRVNEMGVYLDNPIRDEKRASLLLAGELERVLPVFNIMQTRQQYESQASKQRDRREYGIVSVSAQLQEIEDLLGAITIIAGVVILMFLGIVVVGVSNTFTMIVWERTREIGTLRALGMQRSRAVISFLIESVFLGLSGVLLGMSLGIGLLEFVQYKVSFPPNMVSSLFLTQGRLSWFLPVWGILLIMVLMVGASILGSIQASLRAGHLSPAEALRRGK